MPRDYLFVGSFNYTSKIVEARTKNPVIAAKYPKKNYEYAVKVFETNDKTTNKNYYSELLPIFKNEEDFINYEYNAFIAKDKCENIVCSSFVKGSKSVYASCIVYHGFEIYRSTCVFQSQHVSRSSYIMCSNYIIRCLDMKESNDCERCEHCEFCEHCIGCKFCFGVEHGTGLKYKLFIHTLMDNDIHIQANKETYDWIYRLLKLNIYIGYEVERAKCIDELIQHVSDVTPNGTWIISSINDNISEHPELVITEHKGYEFRGVPITYHTVSRRSHSVE